MESFTPPTASERLFNKFFGFLVRLGLGLSHNFLLEVRGRKTGWLYSTPVDVLVLDGRRYLVAPRGSTSWVRNALANGTVVLKKGRWREEWLVRALSANEKPAVCGAQSLPRSLQARGAALLPGAGGRSRGRVRTARRSVPGLRVVIQAIRTR